MNGYIGMGSGRKQRLSFPPEKKPMIGAGHLQMIHHSARRPGTGYDGNTANANFLFIEELTINHLYFSGSCVLRST